MSLLCCCRLLVIAEISVTNKSVQRSQDSRAVLKMTANALQGQLIVYVIVRNNVKPDCFYICNVFDDDVVYNVAYRLK